MVFHGEGGTIFNKLGQQAPTDLSNAHLIEVSREEFSTIAQALLITWISLSAIGCEFKLLSALEDHSHSYINYMSSKKTIESYHYTFIVNCSCQLDCRSQVYTILR